MIKRVGTHEVVATLIIGLIAQQGVKAQLMQQTQNQMRMLHPYENNVFCNRSRPHYCPDHIACKTKWSAQCGKVDPMPVGVAELIVDVHNDCRDRATAVSPHDPPERFVTYPRLGSLPSSAALMQLNWDEELADLAALWVVSCAVEAEAFNGSQNYAEDPPPPRETHPYQRVFYTGNKTDMPRFNFCFDVSRFAVKGWLWISERSNRVQSMRKKWRSLLWEFCSEVSRHLPQYIIESYRPPQESLGAYFREEGVCMLWGAASRLGCAQRLLGHDDATRLQFEVLACLYGPAPLQRGGRVYEVGEAGSACPPQAPAASARWPHLCVPRSSVWSMVLVAVPVFTGLILSACCLFYSHTF